MNLYFNNRTKQQLQSLSGQLPQAVLLTGSEGAGLLTTAKFLADKNIAAIIEPLGKDDLPNHASGTISVKRIRDLYIESSGKSLVKRIFIIDDADKMSASAQNAFLKLLEEPSASTHFILTTHQPSALLATIRSRVESTNILSISRQQSEDMAFKLKLRDAQAAQALFVATGRPAEIARLSADPKYFSATAGVMVAAKTFLSGSRAEAVEIAFKHAADRNETIQLLQACKNILLHSAKTLPSPEIIARLDRLNTAYDAIAANGNARLQLVAAML